jgi:hypothetical protein
MPLEETVSVLAVTDPAAVTRPAPAYGSVGGWSRSGAAVRLHTVPPGRPPNAPTAPVSSVALTAPVASTASTAADPEPITVTVSVGAGDPGRRDRVLAALRQLITAAGSDIAVAGPVPAEHAPEAEAPPNGLSGGAAEPSWVAAGPSGVAVERGGVAAGPSGVAVERGGVAVERSDRSGAGVLPGIRLEPGPRTLAVGGRRIELSRMEYDLLLFLARHPSQVFSRNQLLAQVWGHTHTGARTVDVHVSRLRTKLGADTDVIATVYGLGYRLADHAAVTVVDR